MEINKKHMRRCALCKKRRNYKTFKFFKTPVCHIKRQRWMDACGVFFRDNDLICQNHFSEQDFINGPGCSGIIRLQPSAVPRIRAHTPEPQARAPTPEPVNMKASMEPPIHMETDSTYMNCTSMSSFFEENFPAEIMSPKEKIDELEEENEILHCQSKERATLDTSISKIITRSQIAKLKKPDKKVEPDKTTCLQAASTRAYRHLYAKGFQLPHYVTLSVRAKKINIDEGVRRFATDCLKYLNNLPDDEKLCFLSFDEMKIQEAYEYDPISDSIKAPKKYAQAAIVRGLKASWKRPEFYDFDCEMRNITVNNIIKSLHEAGLTLVAIVSDMGPKNQLIWKEVEVSICKSKYYSARNTEVVSKKSSLEVDTTNWFGSFDTPSTSKAADNFDQNNSDQISSQDLSDTIDSAIPEVIDQQSIECDQFPHQVIRQDFDKLHGDGLEYVAGYIIRKLDLHKFEDNSNSSWTRVDEVSKGYLIKPSFEFLQYIDQLEHVFYRTNGSTISEMQNLKSHLVEQSTAIHLPAEIKLLFFKCRIYFRVRSLNRRLEVQKQKQRIMGNSKLDKMLL